MNVRLLDSGNNQLSTVVDILKKYFTTTTQFVLICIYLFGE